MSRILILAIVILAGLFLMTVGFSGGGSRIDGDDAMRMLYYGMWGALVGGGILASQRNFGESMRHLGLWLIIIVVLSAVYVFKDDAQNFASRLTAGLIPGRAAVTVDRNGDRTAVLYMGQNGHYEVDATINGVSVPMMVDTGATTIALSYEDAERLGLNPAGLSFSNTVMTANGPARSAFVTLPEVEIAGIRRRNIGAGIAERGKLSGSLLGMNFLGTLRSFSFSGNEMRLQD
ncbi:MAG: TIGR02281 family clan AA aspartic protease [Rhizobiaceae bacterium]|nr:TIGR02281 family clan AA aspartic protease [Rhizobiaceae bacterium]